jgi:hypothetical protein
MINQNSVLRQCRTNYRQILQKAQEYCDRWENLCEAFLPVAVETDGWRFHRLPEPDDPPQGWKLHIAATIITANRIFEKVAPFLAARNIQFKAPVSLHRLNEINSGLGGGYSQVGKFITIYPRTDEEAVRLARELDELTRGIAAPAVPFDSQYAESGCVYYRYGAFSHLEIEMPDGTRLPAIKNLAGQLVPDEREKAKPDWVCNPFLPRRQHHRTAKKGDFNPLETTYRIFRALSQRGKGGVYQAIDLSVNPPRLCLIKEGRRHGEVTWDGGDGFSRVLREDEILAALKSTNVGAPHSFASFQLEDCFYLVMEFVEGKSLSNMLKIRRRRLSIKQVLRYAAQLAELMAGIHAAGWVWRDCKPDNIIITRIGGLRPLDFEGSFPISRPEFTFWRTTEFSPPERAEDFPRRHPEFIDIYAVGAVVYFLFTGTVYDPDAPFDINKLRKNIPTGAQSMLRQLLSFNDANILSAKKAASKFNEILKNLEA